MGSPGQGGEPLGFGDGALPRPSPVHIRRWASPPLFAVRQARRAIPNFAGRRCFGVTDAWSVSTLQPTALACDLWLGLSAGTTAYGAPPNGRLLGVAGVFQGCSAADVSSQADGLLSLAWISSAFLMPVSARWPCNWWSASSCYFTPGDYVAPAGPVAGLGSTWLLSYWLVMRVVSFGCLYSGAGGDGCVSD